jgi:O-antigen/teichoic acid export membrane protein
LWKEVAEAHHKGDFERSGLLYKKVSRLLFYVGSMIAGFLIPWTKDLLLAILGTSYVGGALTLSIMFLYPVHQSMGQIGGTILLATERVKIQVITGIFFMLFSMVASYFVLANKNSPIPGLGLDSIGLALKMVVMQFIQVNVIAFIISKIFNWKFDWWYQPISLLGCLAFGFIAYFISISILGHQLYLPILMGLSGMIFVILNLFFIYLFPEIVGISKNELNIEFDKLRRRL